MARPQGLPVFLECGCCGYFHPSGFAGDCRDDAHRFTEEQLDAKYGAQGWVIVELPTDDLELNPKAGGTGQPL